MDAFQQRFSWKFPVLTLVLTACGGGTGSQTPPPSTTSILSADNVYGPQAPVGATIVSPAVLEAALASKQLTLDTEKDRAIQLQAQQEQLQKDRAFLEALPDKGLAVQLMLAPKPGIPESSGGDKVITLKDNLGNSKSIVTMGDAVTFRNAVTAYQESRMPSNLIAVYSVALEVLDPNVRLKLPSPQSLMDRPLSEVQTALNDLDKRLGAQTNIDLVVPLDSTSLQGQSVTVSDGGANAGNGSDQSGPCNTFMPNGLFRRLNWPLKNFMTSIKDQALRGTCWDFASIAYLETRERVVNERPSTFNLSEQYVNYMHKKGRFLGMDFAGEGDYAKNALSGFAGAHLQVIPESAWTYNPSRSRSNDNTEQNVCSGYTGPCSDTIPQGPMICARDLFGTHCGTDQVNYSGSSGVFADPAYSYWFNDRPLPLGLIRGLLATGQPIIASLDVHPGFDNPNAGSVNQGYVTDFSQNDRGGHEVLLVGFIPDDQAGFAPPVSGGTGGGWFVVKNSWGCSFGDAGYYYIPVSYAQRFFTALTATTMTSNRSAAWRSTLTSLQASAQSGTAVVLSPPSGMGFNATSGSAPNYYVDVPVSGRATASDGTPISGDRLRWSYRASSTVTVIGNGATQMARLYNAVPASTRTYTILLEVLDPTHTAPIPALTRSIEVKVFGAPE